MERFLGENAELVIWGLLGGTSLIFIIGVFVGAGITPKVPRDFSCTESAVIEGYATCVKYERNK